MDDHVAGRPGRHRPRSGEPGTAAGPAHNPRRASGDGDGPGRRQPAGVRGAGVPRPAAVHGAGVGTADPGARCGLLGPGRDRAARPAAGPGVLCGRRTAQHRRRWAGRAGVAPLVARYCQSVVRSISMRADDVLAAEPGLRRLQAPTLIVWGTADPFFHRKWAYWLASVIPA